MYFYSLCSCRFWIVALNQCPYIQEHLLIEGIIHRIGVPTAASWYAFPKWPVPLVFSVLRLTHVQHSAMRSHSNPSLQLLCLPHVNNEKTKSSDFAACPENLDAVVQIHGSILCLNSYTQMAVVAPLVFGGGNLLEYYFKITFNPFILLSGCCKQQNSWLTNWLRGVLHVLPGDMVVVLGGEPARSPQGAAEGSGSPQGWLGLEQVRCCQGRAGRAWLSEAELYGGTEGLGSGCGKKYLNAHCTQGLIAIWDKEFLNGFVNRFTGLSCFGSL